MEFIIQKEKREKYTREDARQNICLINDIHKVNSSKEKKEKNCWDIIPFNPQSH